MDFENIRQIILRIAFWIFLIIGIVMATWYIIEDNPSYNKIFMIVVLILVILMLIDIEAIKKNINFLKNKINFKRNSQKHK